MLHHRENPAGAVDTAVLLCTEWRWNRCTAKLIAGRAQVRKVALQVMADRFDSAEAVRLARIDPDTSIRRWAPALETEDSRTPETLF